MLNTFHISRASLTTLQSCLAWLLSRIVNVILSLPFAFHTSDEVGLKIVSLVADANWSFGVDRSDQEQCQPPWAHHPRRLAS